MEHKMRLPNEPFEKIKSGDKTIEVRLYDEKRRKVKAGDSITFTNRQTNEELTVEVTDICTYNNFEELYKHHGKTSLGYSKDDVASPADMNLYYEPSDVIKYGVVAIEVKLKGE